MPKLSTPENTPLLSENVKADEQKPEHLNENLPRPHVLKNILSFSASLKVEESALLGKISTTGN